MAHFFSNIHFCLQVNIETRLVDEDGQEWNIGVKSNLAIKSFEDRPQGARGSVNR